MSTKAPKLFWPSLLLCLAALVFVEAIRNKGQQVLIKVGRDETTISLKELPTIKVRDVRTRVMTELGYSHSKWMLIVFLSPADCWACLGELPYWKGLSDSFRQTDLEEAFIFVRSNFPEVLSLTDIRHNDPVADPMFSPTADLYFDESGEVDRRVGLPFKTPLTILINTETKQVVAAESADPDSREQSRFISLVRSAIRTKSGAATSSPFFKWLEDLEPRTAGVIPVFQILKQERTDI